MIFKMFRCVLLTLLCVMCHSSLNVTETRSLDKISILLELSMKGLFPGETRVNKDLKPIWNMRTAILYYHRYTVGKAIMWLELAMGVVHNCKHIISNKSAVNMWKESNPAKFEELDKYIPMMWSDIESFKDDMEETSYYVYKPKIGQQGNGIFFLNGLDMYTELLSKGNGGWIVQEFVDPFLVNEKKTHMRVLTLIMVQPDGSREFYVYDKMRIFTAAENFDKKRLVDGNDNSFMLLTNMHQNKIYFENDPENKGKVFSSEECVLDLETVVGTESRDSIYSDMVSMHSILYSIIGSMFECLHTDVSIYDEACFNIMASDVAFDKDGKAYFLEMNNAMAFYNVWTYEEQLEFSNGVAAIARTESPYSLEDSSMWENLVIN